MTYNLRSRGSSHGANVVLVDDYLREWRQAQRDLPKTKTPLQRKHKSSPKHLTVNGEASRLRAVSECINGNGSVTPTKKDLDEIARNSRTRCFSDTVKSDYGRRARSTGITLGRQTPRVANPVRSRSSTKLRRPHHVDIDMLSESFNARAKIQKLDYTRSKLVKNGASNCGYFSNGINGNKIGSHGDSAMVLETDFDYDKLVGDVTNFHVSRLPMDCKLKVFSYLSALDKGRASLVCREWCDLICEPTVWSVVDFTQFPLCHQNRRHDCNDICYEAYKSRIHSFVSRLCHVGPAMKRFAFHYDIGNQQDGWLELMEDVVEHSNCRELTYARLDWKETPVRPFWKDHITWSCTQAKNMMYANRLRQRKFIHFFEKLVNCAPNISHLSFPFDWSYRSVNCITRLSKLKVLVLEKYNFFQSPPLNYLEDLLKNCLRLEKLVLEIWSPSAKGVCICRLNSSSLRHLDISQSHGFYLQQINLPNLETFICKRNPLHGPLTCTESLKLPCLYDILVTGAPNLLKFNDHIMHRDWRHLVYDELFVVLKEHCLCHAHKS